ncbi:helix-turn-helix transcriptional regulator [Gangjinia marincola]
MNIIIGLGIFQGFVFCVLLLSYKSNRNFIGYFIAALVFFIAIANLQPFLLSIGVLNAYPNLIYAFLPWELLFAPVLLLFYKAHFIGQQLKRYQIWLLISPFVGLSLLKVLRIIFGWKPQKFLDWYGGYSFDHLSTVMLFSSVFTQSILLYLLINSYKRDKNLSINYLSKEYFKSLKVILLFLFFTGFFWIAAPIFDFLYTTRMDHYIPFWVLLSIFTYILAYLGLGHLKLSGQRKNLRGALQPMSNTGVVRISDSDITIKFNQLLTDQKLFLDPKLSLEKLASMLTISPSYLSTMLNKDGSLSFNDAVNSYRISYAKDILLDSEFDQYTVIAIGLESGFNSKSAFYAAFKKFTGMSPSEYRRNSLRKKAG